MIADDAFSGGPARARPTPDAPIVLIGAGGHMRVLWSILVACGRQIVGAPDANPDLKGRVMGLDGRVHDRLSPGEGPMLAIIGDDAILQPDDGFVIAVGVGVQPTQRDPGTGQRRRLQDRLTGAGFACCSVVDPSAIIRGQVELEPGCQIMAGVVIQTGSRIATGAIVNTGAIVDHDCSVGAHAFIAPGSVLCGSVTIGEGAFVGAGARILPGVSVGAGAVVRAGAILRKPIGPGGLGI